MDCSNRISDHDFSQFFLIVTDSGMFDTSIIFRTSKVDANTEYLFLLA